MKNDITYHINNKINTMNIFFLHHRPRKCAQYHCDVHVVKMILETAQLLYTCLWMCNGDFDNTIKCAPLTKSGNHGYRKTHVNHPCSKWLRESLFNYRWVCKLGVELCKEYTFRYSKIHSTQRHIEWLSCQQPKIEYNNPTPIPLAMPEEYRSSDYIESHQVRSDTLDGIRRYRRYYIDVKGKFAKWKKGRSEPDWFTK